MIYILIKYAGNITQNINDYCKMVFQSNVAKYGFRVMIIINFNECLRENIDFFFLGRWSVRLNTRIRFTGKYLAIVKCFFLKYENCDYRL